MRIGYAKLGRSWNLDPASWSSVGGDVDVWRLLHRLAHRRPGDNLVLVGRNSGHTPSTVGLPPNVLNPYSLDPEMDRAMKHAGKLDSHRVTPLDQLDLVSITTGLIWPYFKDLDQVIVWAGQHGTSNKPITPVGELPPALTNPQTSSVCYGGYLIEAINRWQDKTGREPIWLVPDPRNYLKGRDHAHPIKHDVLGQFTFSRKQKFFRPGRALPSDLGDWDWENGTMHSWVSTTNYVYSGLEMTALDPGVIGLPAPAHEARSSFGMIINENAPDGSAPRLDVLREWVLPWCPDVPLYGRWRLASVKALGRDTIDSVPVTEVYNTMARWRCTFTTPASSSEWATSKPWEAFASDTVCFFHPKYDTQNNILGNNTQLIEWLRVDSPEQLQRRVQHLDEMPDTWAWLVNEQRKHLLERLAEDKIGRMIGERLGA